MTFSRPWATCERGTGDVANAKVDQVLLRLVSQGNLLKDDKKENLKHSTSTQMSQAELYFMFPSHLNHMSSHCFFWRMKPLLRRPVMFGIPHDHMCSRISWVFGGCLVCQYISCLSFLKKLAPIPPQKKTHTPHWSCFS